MRITLVVMFLLAGVTTTIAYVKDHRLPLEGLKAGGKMFWAIFS